MKLFKEDGQINYEDLRDILWTLRNHKINRHPPRDNIPNYMRVAHERHLALLKQTIETIDFDYRREKYLWHKIVSTKDLVDKLKDNVTLLEQEKEQLESEVKTLKDKIQEAQVTAGLFIQSIKDKLPSWFTKDKET